jgi:DNA-binding transcriptional LysR family regulator
VIVRKLEYLIALANERHFSRAAAACHVSQPTLSAAIQQLELELGVPIVKRCRRFNGFTKQGEAVLAWARRSVQECEQLRETLREQVSIVSGHLEICVLSSASPIVRLFSTPFCRRYPNVRLRIVEQSALEIRRALENSTLEFAITYLDETSLCSAGTRVLYAEQYQLVVQRSAFPECLASSWEEAGKFPLCLPAFETGIVGTAEWETLRRCAGGPPRLITNALWTVLDHVRGGGWASVLPRSALALIEGDNGINALPLPVLGEPRYIGVAAPNPEYISPIANAFLEIAGDRSNLEVVETLICDPLARSFPRPLPDSILR